MLFASLFMGSSFLNYIDHSYHVKHNWFFSSDNIFLMKCFDLFVSVKYVSWIKWVTYTGMFAVDSN